MQWYYNGSGFLRDRFGHPSGLRHTCAVPASGPLQTCATTRQTDPEDILKRCGDRYGLIPKDIRSNPEGHPNRKRTNNGLTTH
jgi:hypothetical protein